MAVEVSHYLAFSTPAALREWFENHYQTDSELWVQIYKKASGTPSVSWDDVVIESLVWGWIDGMKKRLDDASYLQRITPRRPKSAWSKRNCDHVDRLISEGKMRRSGLAQVDAAKADGRWDSAYSGSKDMIIPEDFLAALENEPTAKASYDKLNRANLFAIYHRLHSAKKSETRERRLRVIIEMLARGEKFH